MSEDHTHSLKASTSPVQLDRDPVCGMNVNPSTAKHSYELAAKKYYFYCGGCGEKFKADPQKYLSKPTSGLVTLGMAPKSKPAVSDPTGTRKPKA